MVRIRRPLDISPIAARDVKNGAYTLFGVPCPTDVMAAYERLHAGVQRQNNGDVLLAWVVTTTLVQGDVEFGDRVVDALERMGWQRPPTP